MTLMDTSTPNSPLPSGGACRLTDRGVIRAVGADAASFLHGQLSNDVSRLGSAQARLGAYCSPQGRMLASLVFARSGLGIKHGIAPANCVGVIDSDYRGEIKVQLIRDALRDNMPHFIDHGDRIAQGLLMPVEKTHFEIVDALSATVRGTGGLGSTGK